MFSVYFYFEGIVFPVQHQVAQCLWYPGECTWQRYGSLMLFFLGTTKFIIWYHLFLMVYLFYYPAVCADPYIRDTDCLQFNWGTRRRDKSARWLHIICWSTCWSPLLWYLASSFVKSNSSVILIALLNILNPLNYFYSHLAGLKTGMSYLEKEEVRVLLRQVRHTMTYMHLRICFSDTI